jgi:hypothetical protein
MWPRYGLRDAEQLIRLNETTCAVARNAQAESLRVVAALRRESRQRATRNSGRRSAP